MQYASAYLLTRGEPARHVELPPVGKTGAVSSFSFYDERWHSCATSTEGRAGCRRGGEAPVRATLQPPWSTTYALYMFHELSSVAFFLRGRSAAPGIAYSEHGCPMLMAGRPRDAALVCIPLVVSRAYAYVSW